MISQKNKLVAADSEQTFVSHLVELRGRLLRAFFGVLAIFLMLFPFAQELYSLLATPLIEHLPSGTSMIATEVTSPFLTPFKFTLFLAGFLAMPYLLYQAWSFIAPGLYAKERKLAFPLLASSVALFYLGMSFAYFVVFPMVFRFFIGHAPEGVTVMTDIGSYLDFVLKMFFAFGFAFEVPIIAILLVVSGITTPEALIAKRSYVIVAAFVFGAIFTPPDVLSQFLLAIPMWLLFEVGVYISKLLVKSSATDVAATSNTENQNPEETTTSANTINAQDER